MADADSNQAVNGTEDANDSWKYQAPYKLNDNFDVKHEGSCHCGKVKFQLSREVPLDSKLCHCAECQVPAPFQWAAIFHKEDVQFLDGHHKLEFYSSGTKNSEHTLPCKVRCNFCRSPIFDEGRTMVLLFPSLIYFRSTEAKENFKPKLHMFYSQRVMDIPDGLPKWSGMQNQSALIEDSPPEMVEAQANKKQDAKA